MSRDSSPPPDMLQHALAYAERGWRVHPLKARDKRPLLTDWPNAATANPDTIREWWAASPKANIGLATGSGSGVIVIDIDPRNGGSAGLAALKARYGELPETVEAATGGGGRHLFFCYPAGVDRIHNAANLAGAAGVDVKADGGSIVISPSVHPSGHYYTWACQTERLANLPESWLALLTNKAAKPGQTPGDSVTDKAPAKPEAADDAMIRRAVAGMLGVKVKSDENDGSGRLLIVASRAVAHNLPDPAAVRAVRQYEKVAPFPRSYSDSEIIQRVRDAEKKTARGSAGAKKTKVGQSEKLVRLALELFRIGVSSDGDSFAVPIGGPNLAFMFRGSSDTLRAKLAREFRQLHNRTPSAAALADALTVLAGEAQDRETEAVGLRVAEHDGGVVVDLATADGAAVLVNMNGWTITDKSPVLFRRTALTGTLPKPERGGSVDELRELLNVTPETWPLVLGWLVAAYLPTIPHPVLLLGGEQGAGKSTAARMLFRLFDPGPALLRTAPRDAEQWAVAAAASWGVCLDNVSKISEWFSDTLCKAVTGDGFMKRTLYTNSDVTILAFRRVVCLTSIDTGALKGDLGERVILADLERIDPARRRAETDLESRFAERRARLFGALLDVLAAVLRELPSVNVEALPRMADFGRVLAAMDKAIGTDALTRYVAQGGRVAAEVIEADPVGLALVAAVKERGELVGTAGEILAAVKPETPGREWPSGPRAMAGRLRRLAGALRATGVEVASPDPTARPRRYVLQSTVGTVGPSGIGLDATKNSDFGSDGCPTVEGSETPDRRAENTIYDPENGDSRRSDGCDGRNRVISGGGDWPPATDADADAALSDPYDFDDPEQFERAKRVVGIDPERARGAA